MTPRHVGHPCSKNHLDPIAEEQSIVMLDEQASGDAMDLLLYELEMGTSPQPPVLSPPDARSAPLVSRLRRWAHRLSHEQPAA